jgi:hypothetical protein
MTLRFFVQTVRRDGSVILSQPFALESAATRWARLARRDETAVARTLVIVRRVQSLDPPDKAA